MEDNTNPGLESIQPATPAPEQPVQPMQIPVNDSTVEPAAEPVVEPVAPNIIADSPSETGAAEFASEETPLQNEILRELDNPDEDIETIAATTPEPPKKSHAVTALVIILIVVALGLAGAFAYLYFTKPTVKLTDNTSSKNTTTNPVKPVDNTNTTDNTDTTPTDTTDTTSSFTTEGTTITNSDVISELTEKASLLLGYEFDDNLIISTGGSVAAEDVDLVTTGNLKETYKINHLAYKLAAEARSLTDEEVDTIENEDNISLVLTDKKGIDGDVLAEAYKDLFGEELEKGPFEKSACSYSYNASVDVYYNGNGGCGGSTGYYRYYRITDFTEKEKAAYVYIQAASVNDYGSILCDISREFLETGADSTVETCGPALTETTSPEEFFSDTTAKFARYRFVFNQADDDSYYFVKVEKL